MLLESLLNVSESESEVGFRMLITDKFSFVEEEGTSFLMLAIMCSIFCVVFKYFGPRVLLASLKYVRGFSFGSCCGR